MTVDACTEDGSGGVARGDPNFLVCGISIPLRCKVRVEVRYVFRIGILAMAAGKMIRGRGRESNVVGARAGLAIRAKDSLGHARLSELLSTVDLLRLLVRSVLSVRSTLCCETLLPR